MNKSRNVVNLDEVKYGANEALTRAKVLGGRAVADERSSCGGRKIDDDTVFDRDADPFTWVGLLLLARRARGRDEGRLVTVTSDATETEDEEGMRPDIGMKASGRGVRGMAVCVEAVDREDVEDDAEGAGETERGAKGVGLVGVGVSVRGGDGGQRSSMVLVYKVCRKDARRCRLASGNSFSYCKNSFA